MAHFEVDSFVTKWKHLCYAGLTATLKITSTDGEASVVLSADLGQIPPSSLHGLRHHGQPAHRYRGPAYRRRQERRQAARKEAAEQVQDEEHDVLPADEAGASSVDAAEQVASETEDANDILADQAKVTFQCLMCDFVSNWQNGLEIHLTRKHAKVEQIDGNATFVDEDLEEDQKYSWTRNYWETGKLGTVYQSFLDANELIEKSNLDEETKKNEKSKILEARKSAFGPDFNHVPPWNRKH